MSSGFITETELAEIRKKKQEEWEKVRKANDPLEAPEQPYDCRSLYERLQEQKQKKELEYEEAHKLKNMIKGLDDDEIEFLDLVDRTKIAADRRKNLEEEKELNDYRNQVANLQEKSLDQKLHADINHKPKSFNSNSRNSQTKLLKGVVIPNKKRKLSESEMDSKKTKTTANDCKIPDSDETRNNTGDNEQNAAGDHKVNVKTGLQCIAILPGLGYYDESSSDEGSSSSDQDSPIQSTSTDLLGRKIIKKKDENIVRPKRPESTWIKYVYSRRSHHILLKSDY